MYANHDACDQRSAMVMFYDFRDGSHCCRCLDSPLEIQVGPVDEFHIDGDEFGGLFLAIICGIV